MASPGALALERQQSDNGALNPTDSDRDSVCQPADDGVPTGGGPYHADRLLPLVYEELRKLAASRVRALPPGQTIQATALVHEAYARLAKGSGPQWNGKGHFFGAAAKAMRNILVEEARRRGRIKRGGDQRRLPLEAGELSVEHDPAGVLAVADALEALESMDGRKAEVVSLRIYAGLTVEEIAESMGVSARTIERDWRFSRAWLRQRLAEHDGLLEEADGQDQAP